MYKLGLSKKLSVTDIICDLCKKSCHDGENHQYLKLQGLFEYGSDRDGELHRSHICEKCYDAKVRPFLESIAHKPIKIIRVGCLGGEHSGCSQYLNTTEGRLSVDLDDHLGDEYVLESDIDPSSEKD